MIRMDSNENPAPDRCVVFPFALLHALHPFRLGLCLGLVLVSLWLLWLIPSVLTGDQTFLQDGTQAPLVEEFLRVARNWFAQGTGHGVWHFMLLTMVLGVFWTCAGTWVARDEFLRQLRPGDSVHLPPTRFVRERLTSCAWLIPALVFFVGLLMIPGLLAGLVNRVLPWGTGAVLLALLQPLGFLAGFCLTVAATGLLTYWIMPATLAAEGLDNFDALSRGYSYFWQQPLVFLLYQGLALTVAALPFLVAFLLLPDNAGRLESNATWVGAAAVALSMFWSLQAPLYVKLRWLVDRTPEHEISEGAPTFTKPTDSTAQTTVPPSPSGAPPASEEKVTGPLRPERDRVTLADTLAGRGSFSLNLLFLLQIGAAWTGLVLILAALASEWVTGIDQWRQAEGVRAQLLQMLDQHPLLLAVLMFLATAFATLGSQRLFKMVARSAVVRAAYNEGISPAIARSFRGNNDRTGFGGALLVTGGIALYLFAGIVAVQAHPDTCPWKEIGILAGCGLVLLGLGSFLLGSTAADGNRPMQTSGPAVFLDDGVEIVVAGLLNLGNLVWSTALTIGFAWAAWFVMCENLSWWGGDEVQWVRWGLTPAIVPSPQTGLYRGAAGLAGFWFVLVMGLVLVYPISYVLHSGAVCYLLGRQQSLSATEDLVVLTDEEQTALLAKRQKARKRSK
jgi:hypothetical protein